MNIALTNLHIQVEAEYSKTGVRSIPSGNLKNGLRAYPPPISPFLPPESFGNSERQGNLKYWGSVAKRSDITEKVNAYFEPCMKWSEDHVSTTARKMVEQRFAGMNVEISSIQTAFKTLPSGSSPGFPLNRCGIKDKKDGKAWLMYECNRMKKLLRKGKINRNSRKLRFPPCDLGFRSQLCEVGENKPRLVWIYPGVVKIFEQMFSVPWMDAAMNNDNLGWNVNWLHGCSYNLWRQLTNHDGATYGIDFRSFDRRICSEAIKWAFSLLRKSFNFKYRWQKNVWKMIVHYFIHTPLLAYDEIFLTHYGIPSGSAFTQIIGSLVNLYLSTDIAMRLGIKNGVFKHYDTPSFDDIFIVMRVLGDDSLVKLKFMLGGRDRKWIEHLAFNIHNMVVHPAKGFFYPRTDDMEIDAKIDFEFLGKNLVGPYDVTVDLVWLRSQLYVPEEPDLVPGDVLTRIIGLMWSSGSLHEHYLYLRRMWDWIRMRYPDAQPTLMKRGQKRWFLFVEGTAVPDLRLPDYGAIYQRYATQNKRRLYSTCF